MQELLSYYVLLTTAILIVFIFLTLILLRRDKHFALALTFSEICMYIAVSTFGQAPLSQAVLSIGDVQASVDVGGDIEPPYLAATSVIMFCGVLAVVMMALRTWDKVAVNRSLAE